LFDHHLQRLASSAEYFSYPLDLADIRHSLAGLAAGFDATPRKIRLLVDAWGCLTLQAEPLPQVEPQAPLRLLIAPTPVDSTDPFLYHKTTHRQVYDQARLAALAGVGGDWDEVILWNERGELTEACTANIVIELDGECYTPPVSSGLLAGTFRAWLLEQGAVKERVIRLEDLQREHRLYLINSVRKQRQAQVSFHPALTLL
jgi:para-aminobenzoate synthetase/4-amino-4-deoxychorismate lyase